MKKSMFKTIAVVGVLTLSLGVTALAQDHISSYKTRETENGQYRATGWVNIVDDSGTDVEHYTTAQLKQSKFWGSDLVLETSGRVWGTGTVHATTDWNPNSDSYAAIYYGK